MDMAAEKGILNFYIKSAQNGSILYQYTGNTNNSISTVFLEAGKYQAIISGENLWGTHYKVKGDLWQKDTSDFAHIKESLPLADTSIQIDTIHANEWICIGQISLDKNISYRCEIRAETGTGLFVGLSSDPITSINNNFFYQAYGTNEAGSTINAYFTSSKPATYYIYIGNTNEQAGSIIENITGSLYFDNTVQTSTSIDTIQSNK